MDLKLAGDNNLQKLMNILPEKLIIQQVKKEWYAKTKGLVKLPKDLKKIKSLKTDGTRKIKYNGKTAHKCLSEFAKTETITKEDLKFIKWFQTDYIEQSFEIITGKKMVK